MQFFQAALVFDVVERVVDFYFPVFDDKGYGGVVERPDFFMDVFFSFRIGVARQVKEEYERLVVIDENGIGVDEA